MFLGQIDKGIHIKWIRTWIENYQLIANGQTKNIVFVVKSERSASYLPSEYQPGADPEEMVILIIIRMDIMVNTIG